MLGGGWEFSSGYTLFCGACIAKLDNVFHAIFLVRCQEMDCPAPKNCLLLVLVKCQEMDIARHFSSEMEFEGTFLGACCLFGERKYRLFPIFLLS